MDGERANWRLGAIAAGIFAAFVAPALMAAPGDPLGAPFVVPSTPDSSNLSAAVARSANGDFVVAWESLVGKNDSGEVVRVRRFKADGTPQGNDLTVNAIALGVDANPAVAMDGNGDFVVAWNSLDRGAGQVWARRYSAAGVGGVPLLVGSGRNAVGQPSVAMDADGDFVAGWTEASGFYPVLGTVTSCYYDRPPCLSIAIQNATVRARRFSAKGLPLGTTTVVDTIQSATIHSLKNGTKSLLPPDRYPPGLSLGSSARVGMAADGGYVVTWSRKSVGNGFETFTRHYSKYNVAEAAQLVEQGDGGPLNPTIAMAPSGDYAVVYARGGGIYARPYSAAGTSLGAELRVDDGTFPAPRAPSVAMDQSGGFIITWDQDGYDDAGYAARARHYGAGGTPADPIIRLDPPGSVSWFPVVASDAQGNFVGAWYDCCSDQSNILARLFSAY